MHKIRRTKESRERHEPRSRSAANESRFTEVDHGTELRDADIGVENSSVSMNVGIKHKNGRGE